MTHSYRKLLKPKTFISAALVLCMSMLAACGSSSPSSSDSGSDASNSPIKLGVLEDRSGDFALVGMQKYHAAELAVDEINKSGGLLAGKLKSWLPIRSQTTSVIRKWPAN